jgi:hypothetical protein
MDLHTSISDKADPSIVADDVLPLCELAKTLEEAGEFERGAETLQGFWKGLLIRPETSGLVAEA